MPSEVSNLDQDYIESLKQRNALIKQLNVSLQVQINEAQSRAYPNTGSAVEKGDTPLPPPPPPPPPLEPPLPPPPPPLLNGQSTKSQEESTASDSEDGEPDKNDTKESEEKKRFRVVVNKWNSTDKKWEDSEDASTKKSAQLDKDNRHIIYRRHTAIENERKCHYEECEIPLQGLKNLLRDNMSHVDNEFFDAETINFGSPFLSLVWNWDSLERAAVPKETDDAEMKESRSDLKMLLDNVRISEPCKVSAYFKERDPQIAAKSVTFGTLWTLFQPGARVVAKPFMDEWQMFEVQSSYYYSPPPFFEPDSSQGFDHFRLFRLFCAGFDWDGRHFRRYTYKFEFEKFEGRRLIHLLQCFPLEFWSTETTRMELPQLETRLKQRGRQFAKFCTAKKENYLCKYDGFLLHGVPPRFPHESLPRVTRRVIKKQNVIVDNVSFMESKRNEINEYFTCPPLGQNTWIESLECCSCADCGNGPIKSWSVNDIEDREKERLSFIENQDRLLFCPPKVLGYVPMQRLWAQFSVDRLEEIKQEQKEIDKECFEHKLELDKKHKKMLKALIENHEARKNKASSLLNSDFVQDPIDGKGRGLAILLHGPPGVGKTLTAEAVALATAKPLLFVSVAELGMEPHFVEEKLLDMFEDASRWDAVMVIDEADVFLEERIGTTDVTRNALVSVLLRVLEYHDGIIILTTNRITSLDIAVQSRMHLAIQYRDLNEIQKKNIFTKFLNDIPKDQIEERDVIDRQLGYIWRRMDLNGRQIRNIVAGAQALANSEGELVSWDHISRVYDATTDFVQSLKDLTIQKRGRNEA